MAQKIIGTALVILCLNNACLGLKTGLPGGVANDDHPPMSGDTRVRNRKAAPPKFPSQTLEVEIVRRSLPTDKAAVRVLQMGDRTMMQEMKEWTASVRAFAEIGDFEYAAHTLPTFANGYEYTAQKPLVFQEELSDMRDGDWLVYVDLDMAVDRQAAEDLLKTNPDSKTSLPSFLNGLVEDGCNFVAQDFEHSLNTGFLALRAGKESRQLVDMWVKERERIGVRDDGFVDALPLESSLMHLAIENYANECDKTVSHASSLLPANAKATLDGRAEKAAGKKGNACFRRTMEDHGYGYQKRSFGGVCFVDPEKKRLNMAQATITAETPEYKKGDLFYHGKDKKIREDISETWSADMTMGQFIGRRPYVERRAMQ